MGVDATSSSPPLTHLLSTGDFLPTDAEVALKQETKPHQFVLLCVSLCVCMQSGEGYPGQLGGGLWWKGAPGGGGGGAPFVGSTIGTL